MPTRPVDPHEVEDLTADPDDGHGEGVDGDLESQHDGPPGNEAHEWRRTTGQTERFPALLDDQTGRCEIADQPPDAAAGQAGALAELAARQRSVSVQGTHERAQVGPPHALAALPLVSPHVTP